jgi:hypothetical protein
MTWNQHDSAKGDDNDDNNTSSDDMANRIRDIRQVLLQNGEYQRLKQRFLSELILWNDNSNNDTSTVWQHTSDLIPSPIETKSMTTRNDTFNKSSNLRNQETQYQNETPTMMSSDVGNRNSRNDWIGRILDGLRTQKDIDSNRITLDELKEIVTTLGKASIPREVQDHMMIMIRSATVNSTVLQHHDLESTGS